jgi:hypothetical protein
MAENLASMPLGQKMKGGLEDRKLGLESWFQDCDYTAPGTKIQLSAQRVKCVLARMSGTTPIAPGANIAWDKARSTFDVVAGAGEVANGQVDPYLNANIAQDEVCWIVIEGPTLVTASAAISAGASIKTAADGKAVTNDYSSNPHTAYGMMIEAATQANQKKRAYVNFETR